MEQKESKLGTGFMLGLLVGGAIVFLIGTKKGRKILKSLSESGKEVVANVSDIERMSEMEEDLEEEIAESEESMVNHGVPQNGKVKKFFRGIKKK